jgi:glucose/arabinose dehydrogenase
MPVITSTPPPPAIAASPTIPIPTDTPLPTPSPTPAAVSPPNPNAYALRRIVSGLEEPVFLTHAGDGSGRLFIVEQPGTIRVLHASRGALLPDPFLDLRDIVNDSGNEQGLLGLAFHPQYSENGRFFVNYTDANGDTAIVRYTVSASDPDRADPSSAALVLQVSQPFANHNGGNLVFGPDGFLYVGLGDGGAGGDPQGNAQNLNTLLGKMLRIDVNADPYAVPPDNPFTNRPDARPEIWAYGLRNPWRYSFDRATGDLYIGDVGQNAYEEIDHQPAGSPGGENYGWDFMEGSHPFEGVAPEGLTAPATDYAQSEGGCSVTGGHVYRGPGLPQLQGVYLFGDYCTGTIWGLYRADGVWQRVKLLDAFFTISSFGEDEAGEVYVLDHRGGAVYQVVAAP